MARMFPSLAYMYSPGPAIPHRVILLGALALGRATSFLDGPPEGDRGLHSRFGGQNVGWGGCDPPRDPPPRSPELSLRWWWVPQPSAVPLVGVGSRRLLLLHLLELVGLPCPAVRTSCLVPQLASCQVLIGPAGSTACPCRFRTLRSLTARRVCGMGKT